MAAPDAIFEWIAPRLPSGLDANGAFDRNGVSKTVREAVDQAYDDNAGKQGQKMLALADLLEILASDDRFTMTVEGPFTGQGPLLMDRAAYFRKQAANANATVAGSMTGVRMNYDRCAPNDEYSSDNR